MGWIVFNEPKHLCDLPSCYEAGIGSIWKCDICEKKYKIITDGHYGLDWINWSE